MAQSEVCLCYRIRSEHHSSIVEVDGLYHNLLSTNSAGAVPWLSIETRRVQSELKCRACTHVETAAWWLASAGPRERHVYEWWLHKDKNTN